MCGIIGYVGSQDAVPILLAGLRRLEYRGYDSAGVAVAVAKGLRTHKTAGRIAQLEATLPRRLRGKVGIGHTRWATHGEPTDANAHPHLDCAGDLALVHNGIVENAEALRRGLEEGGHVFRSETDTEVLAHLVEAAYDGDLEGALRLALASVQGTYGIAVIHSREPDRIVVARSGSPVVVGIGEKEMFVASDVAALVRHTRQVIHLEDGEIATVDASGVRTSTQDALPTFKEPSVVAHVQEDYERGDYEHFMQKEIHDQPAACERTLRGRLDRGFGTAHLGGLNAGPRDLLEIRRIKILGCGSAYYAGIAGAHILESTTRIPTDAEPASEFRYRSPVIEKEVLYVAVSQSGETADTLAAVREVRRKGGRVLGVVNAVGSTIARECDGGIYMHAGPEIAVASTKAFTCSVVAMALLALHLGRVRDLSLGEGRRLVDALEGLPDKMRETLAATRDLRMLAARYAPSQSAFFVGRAGAYAIALEGAQKLKEISYIHAEAYPASELKHGPLALITEETPVFVVLPHDDLYEKTLSTIEEVRARRGPVIAVTHPGDESLAARAEHVVVVPKAHPLLAPLLLNLPLQVFAYECAVALGRDVDQPRHLAKSVTVE